MAFMVKQKSVELLIEHFWLQGFMTVKRKFGKYLPEPERIGGYDVDVVARHKEDYAIGITLQGEDFRDTSILEKLQYLASRQTRHTNKRVMLYVGVPAEFYKNGKALVYLMKPELRQNVRIIPISERKPAVRVRKKQPLFS